MPNCCATPWTIAHQGPPSVHGISQARILEWVAISFSRGSSQPKDWTHVSCIGRQILYHWATKEAMGSWKFIKEYRDEDKWYKWRSSQMTLELWLGGGNKNQEVCPELITRTNELGGKWFQLVKVRFLLQKTDGKNSRKHIRYLIFNLPSNTWTVKL